MNRSANQSLARSQRLVGLVVVAVGVACLWQAATMTSSPIAGPVGSSTALWAIGFALIALGASLFIQTRRGPWKCEAQEAQSSRPVAVAWLLSGWLAAYVLIWLTGSFILAALSIFVLSVRAFRNDRWGRAITIGLVAASVVYAIFAGLLGLNIGEGPPERVLRWLLRF